MATGDWTMGVARAHCVVMSKALVERCYICLGCSKKGFASRAHGWKMSNPSLRVRLGPHVTHNLQLLCWLRAPAVLHTYIKPFSVLIAHVQSRQYRHTTGTLTVLQSTIITGTFHFESCNRTHLQWRCRLFDLYGGRNRNKHDLINK